MLSQFISLTRSSYIAVVFTITITITQTGTVSFSELTKSQVSAIQELRHRVQDNLPHSYMKDDLYLLRWLTAKNFDVNEAASALMLNLEWRAENSIDSILEEDWERMDTEYPYQLHNVDKFGRPILYLSFGEWDIRKLAVSGMLPKLNRYFSKMFEEADSKVRGLHARNNNVTQFNLILNMDGYNLAQHACFQCLPFYSTLTQTLEARYPGTAEQVIFVNSPTLFEFVLRLIQGVLSEQARDTIKVYGADRRVWEPILLQFIDRDQLPTDLQ